MEGNVKKPLKLRIYFGGKPPQGAAAAAPTCSLCARTFSSVKALHGHMRWHKPPPPPPAAPSTHKPFEQVDPPPALQPLLWGWSKTAKRTLLFPVRSDLKVFDGIEGRQGKDAPEDEPTSEISMDAGVAASEEDVGTLEHCGQAAEPSKARACGSDCCRKWRSSPCGEKREAGGFEEARGPGLVGGGGAYACGACGKAFHSYPALCGHMASHGKQHNHPRDESPSEGVGWSTGSSNAPKRRRMKAANPGEHRCNVCSRVFPTGQALGGHKRLHWEGPKSCPPLLLFPPAPTPEGTGNTWVRVHDFDLNETAMVEDGAEGGLQELLLLV